MSNVTHYGIAATIARTAEENSAADRAYIDSKVTDVINTRIIPLNVKVDTKVDQTKFDTVLNPPLAAITITL